MLCFFSQRTKLKVHLLTTILTAFKHATARSIYQTQSYMLLRSIACNLQHLHSFKMTLPNAGWNTDDDDDPSQKLRSIMVVPASCATLEVSSCSGSLLPLGRPAPFFPFITTGSATTALLNSLPAASGGKKKLCTLCELPHSVCGALNSTWWTWCRSVCNVLSVPS